MSALATARAERDTAKSALRRQLAQVRADLAAKGIGGRIKDRIVDESAETAVEAAEIVQENKLVIGATLSTIALWFMRHPLANILGDLGRGFKKGMSRWR